MPALTYKSEVISVRLVPEQIQKLDSLQKCLKLSSRGEVIRMLLEKQDFNPTGEEV